MILKAITRTRTLKGGGFGLTLTPPVEVFLNILESLTHELRIAHGLTLVTPSLRAWEALSTPRALTLRSLGPSHQRHHKSQVSLWGPPCALGVLGSPYGEVCDTHLQQTESMPSSTILVVSTPMLKLPSSAVRHCINLGGNPHNASSNWHSPKGICPRYLSNF